jgi:restriction system protein
MPILDFQSLTLPVLSEFADGREHTAKEIRQRVAVRLGLTQEELAELLPSRSETRFANRIAWARAYLRQAALLSPVRRGVYRITTRGQELLKTQPAKITVRVLSQYPEFTEFQARKSRSANTE